MKTAHISVVAIVLFWGGACGAGNLGFDFLVLVRQWGPTFCETKGCTQPAVGAFTIHGLWPNYANGGYPQDCVPSNKFSTNNLAQPLLQQMSCEWVSYTGSNAGFWSYEWSKHGTCALSLFPTQQAYFDAAVQLNNQFEPNAALTTGGVQLSAVPALPVSQLQDVLAKAWGGVAPLVTCDSSNLLEVWLCIDPTSLKPKACPSSVRPRACPSSVSFPTGAAVPPQCAAYYQPSGSPPNTDGGNNNGSSRSEAANDAAGALYGWASLAFFFSALL